MQYSLKERLFLSSSAVLAGMMVVSAMTTPVTALSYVAHGTTDAKTAQLMQSLLKNSKRLQIHTQQRRVDNQPTNVVLNYTVKGTTDVKTAKKLIQMFKNNKHMEVAVMVSKRSSTHNIARQTAPMPLYMPKYPSVYMQNPNNPNAWIPVAVWKNVAVPAVLPKLPIFRNVVKNKPAYGPFVSTYES